MALEEQQKKETLLSQNENLSRQSILILKLENTVDSLKKINPSNTTKSFSGCKSNMSVQKTSSTIKT